MIRPTSDSMIRKVREAKLRLISASEAEAVVFERLARKTEADIIRLLQTGDYELTTKEYNRLMGELARLLGRGNGHFNKLRAEVMPRLARLSVRRQSHLIAEMYGAKRWQGVSSRRVVEAFRGLNQSPRMKIALRSSFVEWRGTWDARWDAVRKTINGTLQEGIISGLSNQDMAKRLMSTGSIGDLAGVGNPEHFAFSLARTEMSDLQNRLSVAINQEIGIKKYANVGVADERQSDQCYQACQQKPMTLKEWNAWRYGPPGRHVKN